MQGRPTGGSGGSEGGGEGGGVDLWALWDEYEKAGAPAFKTILISLVVVRQGTDHFCSTHEHDGWYLPAGRVDFGETFSTGATREALEEAGIPVKLEAYFASNTHLVLVYSAVAADDTPLKSVADHEVIEAKWCVIYYYIMLTNPRLTIDELRTKSLRADEVLELFKWAHAGTRVFPCSYIEGVDGNEISHTRVVAQVRYALDVIIKDGDRYLACKSGDTWSVPTATMKRPQQFKTAAINILTEIVAGAVVTLDGILKFYHVPSPTKDAKGLMKTIFVGRLPAESVTKLSDKIAKGKKLRWMSLEELRSQPGLKPQVARDLGLAAQVGTEGLAPLEFLAMEMEMLKVIA